MTARRERTGELVWRLPLHREYATLVKGTFADLNNAPAGRRAGAITAAEFLHRFAGETPWAHLDIAGTAWDLGRPYAEKGGSGLRRAPARRARNRRRWTLTYSAAGRMSSANGSSGSSPYL